jgi:hypothetical protein
MEFSRSLFVLAILPNLPAQQNKEKNFKFLKKATCEMNIHFVRTGVSQVIKTPLGNFAEPELT